MSESHREEIAKLEALYAGNPGGRVFVHLAEALRKAGEHARAESILAEGLARHADSASGYVVLGRVMADMGNAAEAETAFRRVLELDGGNLVALRWLGDLAREGGRPAEALGHYRELLARSPSSADVEYLVREVEEELEGAASGPAVESEGEGESAPLAVVREEGTVADPEVMAPEDEVGEAPARAEPEYRVIEADSLPGDLAVFAGAPEPEPPAAGDPPEGGTVLDDDVVELLESSAAPYELEEVDGGVAAEPADAHLLSAAPSIDESPPWNGVLEVESPADERVEEADADAGEGLADIVRLSGPEDEALEGAGEQARRDGADGVLDVSEPFGGAVEAAGTGPGEPVEAAADTVEPLSAPEPLDLSELSDIVAGPEEETGDAEGIDVSDVRRYDEPEYATEAPLDLSAFSGIAASDSTADLDDALTEPGDLDLEIGDLGIDASDADPPSEAADAEESTNFPDPGWDAEQKWGESAEEDWSPENEDGVWLDPGPEETEVWRPAGSGMETWRDEAAMSPGEWAVAPGEESETPHDPATEEDVRPPEEWTPPTAAEAQSTDVAGPDPEAAAGPDAWFAPEAGSGAEEAYRDAGTEGGPGEDVPAEPGGGAQEDGPWVLPEPVEAAAASEVVERAAPKPAAESGPPPRLATETLAELYMAQGFPDRAAEVYRTLLAHRPDSEHLAEQLRKAEAASVQKVGEDEAGEVWLRGVESAWTGGAGAAATRETPYAWTEPGEEARHGPPIGEYLKDLVSWRSGAAAAETAGSGAEPSAEAAAVYGAASQVEADTDIARVEPEPPAGAMEAGPDEAAEGGGVGIEAEIGDEAPESRDDAASADPAGSAAGPWTPAGDADWQPEPEPAWSVSPGANPDDAQDAEVYGGETPADPWLAPEASGLGAFEIEPDPEPASSGGPRATGGGNPVEDAFNEWFGPPEAEQTFGPAESGPMETADGVETGSNEPAVPASSLTEDESEEDQDEDLEMFRSWLQSLKK